MVLNKSSKTDTQQCPDGESNLQPLTHESDDPPLYHHAELHITFHGITNQSNHQPLPELVLTIIIHSLRHKTAHKTYKTYKNRYCWHIPQLLGFSPHQFQFHVTCHHPAILLLLS